MLDVLVRDVRARRQLLHEAMLDDEDTRPLPFVASYRMSGGASSVVAKIRTERRRTP